MLMMIAHALERREIGGERGGRRRVVRDGGLALAAVSTVACAWYGSFSASPIARHSAPNAFAVSVTEAYKYTTPHRHQSASHHLLRLTLI